MKGGETIVIFPEGRVTVTGGLMKAYDGAAMIVDKADAWLVPVRIEGPERSPFGYLRPTQTKKSLFPKFKVTFLPARRLTVDPALKGKAAAPGRRARRCRTSWSTRPWRPRASTARCSQH